MRISPIFCTISLMILTLPLFVSTGATLPGVGIYMSDAMLLLALFLLLLQKTKCETLKFNLTGLEKTILLLHLLYVGGHLLSIHYSTMPEIAWVGFRRILGRVTLALVIMLSIRNYHQLKILFDVMLLTVLFCNIVSLFKFTGIIALTFPQPEKAVMDVSKFVNVSFNQNYGLFYTSGKFALWQSFGILYSLFHLLLFSSSIGRKIFCNVLLLLSVFSVAISFSRNAIVVVLVAMFFVMFVKKASVTKKIKYDLGKILLPLSFNVALIVFFSLVAYQAYLFVAEVRGFGSRLLTNELGISLLFPHRWLWGVGPNVFSESHYLGIDCHNAYMSVWLESGLLSFIAFVSLLIIPIISLRKERRDVLHLNFKSLSLDKFNLFIQLLVICWVVSIAVFPGERTHEIWFLIGLLPATQKILRRKRILYERVYIETK